MNIPGYFEPTATESACLALIRQHESGGDYGILCGGARFQNYSAFPQWRGFRGSHAAGAYQFEPASWSWITIKTAVPDFSPIAQDINALWLLRLVGPNSSESWQASGPYPYSLVNGALVAT